MKWQRGHRSDDVLDRRGMSTNTAKVAAGGGGLVAIILALIFGPQVLEGGGGGLVPPTGSVAGRPAPAAVAEADKELVEFVSFVLDDVQAFWSKEVPRIGGKWRKAQLVLFSDQVESACGGASAASGPFYCPADQLAYIDLSFYRVLKQRFGAPGDFAEAYVLAHEIGHHVQNLLGTARRVHTEQQRDPDNANALSVRLELQADCYAGAWGHSAARRDLLDAGDIEEGLKAAAAIGDDTLQKQAGAAVRPESWTHGSSAQRVRWFREGFESGRAEDCDTFAARDF